MNKEIIIICESIYKGNTMRLAKAMAYALNCEIISANDALNMDLSHYKTVGLGSGIYFTSHHPRIMEVVGKLNTTQKAFIFSTRGAPFLGRYHDGLKKHLGGKNIEVMGEFSSKGFDCTGPFIIIHGGNKGRPNEKDRQKAMKFISQILPHYVKDLSKVTKGHFVEVDQECIACGKCVAICPMNVFEINENTSQPVNEQDCIHCSLCQEACLKQAISINHNFIEAIKIAKKHSKKTSLR